MRGVVALAEAISLPETVDSGNPFPQRSVILFMTFCVIFVTLVVQGLTLPSLIRRLGSAGLSSGHDQEEEARRTMIGAALRHLERARKSTSRNSRPFTKIRHALSTEVSEPIAQGAQQGGNLTAAGSDLPQPRPNPAKGRIRHCH
jgi:NhaP-type Na+/H+ or K+/H+ antiporter